MQKAPLHIKKYIENAIPYKKPVGRLNIRKINPANGYDINKRLD